MRDLQFQYIFDPLCGWCYASAPAIKAVAEAYPTQFSLQPSGLFTGENARPLTADWAQYALSNDMRIAQLTGQVFSKLYRDRILSGNNVQFDSGPATLALTIVQTLAPEHEVAYLEKIQEFRYVRGEDTAKLDVLRRIAGIFGISATDFYVQSIALECERLNAGRISQTHQLMQRLGTSGVPQLIVRLGDRERVLQGQVLYNGAEHLMDAIHKLRHSTRPSGILQFS
jgi:putative protein-disulfide isomerase